MFKNWIKNKEGSTFLIVALGMLAVVGSVGVAVDIGRSQLVQSKLQNAVDAAGLAAGASAAGGNLTAIATKYINANFATNNLNANLTSVSATMSNNNKVLTITASADLPTTLMKVFGNDSVTVDAQAEITKSNLGLELALVLDTTGSMLGGKLDSLKSAAGTLLDILYGNSESVSNLWVGVVPFSQTVNVGSTHTGWLDATHYDGLNWYTSSWGGCVEARYTTGRDVTDDPPYDLLDAAAATPAAPYQRFRAYYAPAPIWSTIGSSTGNSVSICNKKANCTCPNYGPCDVWTATSAMTAKFVTCSGSGNNKSCTQKIRTYQANAQTGPNTGCPSVVTPLTNVKATVQSGIDALVARGNTHINYGAVWGWRLISPRWRGYWGGAMDANNLPLNYNSPLMSKAIVIMTDGDNTTSYYTAYPDGSGITDTALDTKTTAVCNAMKAQDVKVYTILFQQANEDLKTLLRNCATSPDHFFDSPTPESLESAFTTIADSLANLRISK